MSKVNTQMGGEKWFDSKSGVRQGSILSPLIFILYMDLVIKEVHGLNDNDKQFILAFMRMTLHKLQPRRKNLKSV